MPRRQHHGIRKLQRRGRLPQGKRTKKKQSRQNNQGRQMSRSNGSGGGRPALII